jgi:hypothetical protein
MNAKEILEAVRAEEYKRAERWEIAKARELATTS